MQLNITRISIISIWVIHIAAIIGLHLGYYDFFLPKSWITLLLSGMLLLLNSSYGRKLYLLIFAFLLSFFAEALGVATGILFGEYSYGENLGFKAIGVPLIIGLNWVILGLISRTIAYTAVKNLWLRIVLSSIIMVLIDLIIEPVAPKFDYWTFTGGLPTWKNYLGWFLVALPLQFIIEKSHVEPSKLFALNLLAAQLIFFLAFWNA